MIPGAFTATELHNCYKLGADLSNTREFIAAGAIAVGVGSSLSPKDLITKGNFAEIAELAKNFIAEVAAGRK